MRSRWAAPFVLLGQNSLPVFCGGIVLGFIARLGLEYDDRFPMQALVNVFGAAGMLGLGALAARYRVKVRAVAPLGATARLPGDAQPDTGSRHAVAVSVYPAVPVRRNACPGGG